LTTDSAAADSGAADGPAADGAAARLEPRGQRLRLIGIANGFIATSLF
jgi:hypothetical protein